MLLVSCQPAFAQQTAAKVVIPDNVVFEAGIEFANPDQQHLQLDMARPKTGNGPFPAIVCIHGGGFRAGSRQSYDALCIRLAQEGYVAVTISYRLAPKYRFPAAIHDVKEAVRWLRGNAGKCNIDPNRIGAVGGSAGGHLAQFLGVTSDVREFEGNGDHRKQSSRVRCVVNYYGPSDFTRSYGKSVDAAQVLPLFLGGDLKQARRQHITASPLYWVTPRAAPTLCIHGTKDAYVAHEQAVWLVERLRAAGVEAQLLSLEGAGHGFRGPDADKAEKAMLAFFARHLKEGLPETDRAAIFDPAARLKVESGNGSGGEGPAWHPELGVFTSGAGHIHRLDREGKSRIYRKDAGTNGLLFDIKGRLLACEPVLRRVTRTEPDGTITVLTDRYQGKRYNQPNDITVDSRGRIYFSDPCYGDRSGMEMRDEKDQTIEGVYRIDLDGKVTRIIGRELDRPNGVLVSANDRYLFVADNNNDTKGGARALWRFNLREDGTLDFKSRKLLYDWDTGRGPDGIKQDQLGRLYVAAGLNKPNPPFEPARDKKGGIYVLDPDSGKLLAFLPVPTDEVTNCAFGGDDLRTLFITAGGALYSIRTTTAGKVVWPRQK